MPTRPNSKPLIKHAQIIRIPRLLDMLYKPAELAEEIAVNIDTIYRGYIPHGLPHTTDEHGHIWIHGTACAHWLRRLSKSRARTQTMPEGHAWCLRCRRPVAFDANRARHVSKSLTLQQGVCPHCGRTVNRLKSRKLPSPSDALSDGEGARRAGGV